MTLNEKHKEITNIRGLSQQKTMKYKATYIKLNIRLTIAHRGTAKGSRKFYGSRVNNYGWTKSITVLGSSKQTWKVLPMADRLVDQWRGKICGKGTLRLNFHYVKGRKTSLMNRSKIRAYRINETNNLKAARYEVFITKHEKLCKLENLRNSAKKYDVAFMYRYNFTSSLSLRPRERCQDKDHNKWKMNAMNIHDQAAKMNKAFASKLIAVVGPVQDAVKCDIERP